MKTPLPPEFDAMAQRFVDLWQEQWMQLANNKNAADTMQKLTELMVPPANLRSYYEATTKRPETATSASQSLAQQLADLTLRVDALEQRLAAESRAAKPRAKPAPRTKSGTAAGRSNGRKSK